MSDGQKHDWEPDELQRVLAAHHADFDEQYKLLMAKLEKPFRGRSAASKEADARLKALQEYVRNLPPRA